MDLKSLCTTGALSLCLVAPVYAQTRAPAPHPCANPPLGHGPASAECRKACEQSPNAPQCQGTKLPSAPLKPLLPPTPPVGAQPAAPPASPPPPPLTVAPGSRVVPLRPEDLRKRLYGWVDLHTHPMSHLGFGGMLIVGGPDIGSLIPKVHCDRTYVRAQNEADALPNSNATHGGYGFFDNRCGDDLRKSVINELQKSKGRELPDTAVGWPNFEHYPAWDAILHQSMYVDWIRRAWQDGKLRVLVALAVNNRTLADAVRGPGDNLPNDDFESARLQLREMREFVRRHADFMEIARSAADLRRIVGAGKLAVVLGVEVDAIGNYYRDGSATADAARRAIDDLWKEGARYLFPVHVTDNAFGGAAWYEATFAVSNFREFGRYPTVRCATPEQLVGLKFQPGLDVGTVAAAVAKLGTALPPTPRSPDCPSGHVNTRGMTEVGRQAMLHMMQRGLLIDIDHMSDRTLACALRLAEAVRDGGYPVISGHTGLRRGGPRDGENKRHPDQARRIAKLGGIFGLGTEAATPDSFIAEYRETMRVMGPGRVAIGSDANGLVRLPQPPGVNVASIYERLRRASMGGKTWDYERDGVAHYGLFADFIAALELRGGKDVVDSLMGTAEAFAQAWERAEAASRSVAGTTFPRCDDIR